MPIPLVNAFSKYILTTTFPGINGPNIILDAEPFKGWLGTLIGEIPNITAIGSALDGTGLPMLGDTGVFQGRYCNSCDIQYFQSSPWSNSIWPSKVCCKRQHTRWVPPHQSQSVDQSRYPGLDIWTRNAGKRIPVVIFPREAKYLLCRYVEFITLIDGSSIRFPFAQMLAKLRYIQLYHRSVCLRRFSGASLPISTSFLFPDSQTRLQTTKSLEKPYFPVRETMTNRETKVQKYVVFRSCAVSLACLFSYFMTSHHTEHVSWYHNIALIFY